MECIRIRDNPDAITRRDRAVYLMSLEEKRERRKAQYRGYAQKWRDEATDERRVQFRKYSAASYARLYPHDLQYRLRAVLRARLRMAIKNEQKAGSAVTDLGCSILELKSYIEALWKPGMSWGNWGIGKGKWHIDHKRDLVLFDLSKSEQVKLACHYTNLCPLWQAENIVKGQAAKWQKRRGTKVVTAHSPE
jgi:hypothetical protein